MNDRTVTTQHTVRDIEIDFASKYKKRDKLDLILDAVSHVAQRINTDKK